MKNIFIIASALFVFSSCAHKNLNNLVRQPQSELSQSPLFLEQVAIGSLKETQRMGFLLESEQAPFKGCVIYLEGLGDSLMNHFPFFNKLNNAGYRVLFFDYLGQGGSQGSMADTRLSAYGDPFPKNKDYEIGQQARFVWQRYSESKDPVFGRSCAQSPKRVIGWSTGGLAAYALAKEKWSSATVMIAPGIVPYKCVGETSKNCLANLTLDKVITQRTLTSNKFKNAFDPHLEPIKPTSIVKEVKEFAINLISTSYQARKWKFDESIKGLVFLSGPNDTYVDGVATQKILKKNAPHFAVVTYGRALHEIDNEVPEIANDLHEMTLRFFAEEGH